MNKFEVIKIYVHKIENLFKIEMKLITAIPMLINSVLNIELSIKMKHF